MRVALFCETYLPQRNGVALILDRLVRYLAERGHEVLLVTAEPRASGDPDVVPPPGMQLVRVPGMKLPRYPDLTMAIPFAKRARSAVRAFRPDVIHLVTEYTIGLTGLRLARVLDVPALASFHTNIPGCLPYYGFPWAASWCWRYLRWFHNQAAFTLCASETNRRVLEERGFRNVRVWGRGVDTSVFSPVHRTEAARQANGPLDAVQLLYVGRLTPEKDLDVLYDAYRRVCAHSASPPVHLVLVGDGSYSGAMREKAPPGVTFAGYLRGRALSEAYASADVFVFPSRVETLGNVVLEAMASGLPVVGADQGGTVENVRDGENGLLCRAGDSTHFAGAIERLAADQALRTQLGSSARQRAESRSWDAVFGLMVDSYRELVSR